MARPQPNDNRFRVAGFIFIASAIILAASSFYISGLSLDRFQGDPSFQQMTSDQITLQILGIVQTERIIARCMLLSLLLSHIGLAFLLYLLLQRTKRIEDLV